MKITLIVDQRKDPIEVELNEGITLEELAKKYQSERRYTAIAAKVDNKIVELTNKVTDGTVVELLDVRNTAVNYIYQHSLSLIYLKAVHDVLGKVNVEIANSLNKGLFTIIKTLEPVNEAQIKKIEKRMREIVDADIPFVKEKLSRDEALQFFVDEGHREKARLLDASKRTKSFKFYSIDGFRDFFYGLMAPSTGYIKFFELQKYRRGVVLKFPHPSNPEVVPPDEDQRKLYEAFGEATRWCKLMDISFVSDLNEKVKSGNFKQLVQLSEALHEKKVAEIADMITKSGKRIVLIAGPSSSGKTTFAQRLSIQLMVNGLKPIYLGTDDYFVERDETPLDEYGEKDYECLHAVDVKLFNDHMNALLAGDTVDIPRFDFLKGTKVFGERITAIKEDQPIVIEGIHALNDALTPDIPDEQKFKIYISPLTQLNVDEHNRIPTTDARMLRRMVRDNQFRGRKASATIEGWPKVRAGEDKYIFPYSNEADVLFNSVHLYELAVLKKYAEPLLEEISPEEPEYCEAVRMLKFLDLFEAAEDDSMIVNNSILKEFLGGSALV